MKLSSVTSVAFGRVGAEKGFIALKEAGFDYCDYGDTCSKYSYTGDSIFKATRAEFESYFTTHRKYAEAAGVKIGQTHAPFPTYPESRDEAEFCDMIGAIKRAIHATALLDSPYLVIHCAMPKGWAVEDDREGAKALNYKVLSELIPEAERCGITLALENMPLAHIPSSTPEELCDYIDMMNSDHLVACLDTGHANITGVSCGDFVRALGKRLKVLHLHDNNAATDQHLAPFQGTVGWADFSRALREIGYEGTLSHEADSFFKYCPTEALHDTLVYTRKTLEIIDSLGQA